MVLVRVATKSTWTRAASVLIGLSALLGAAGCKRSQPQFVYMPDMAYSAAVKAQEPGSLRVPVKGTVPRDFQGYRWPSDQAAASRENLNPLPRTREVLARGKHIYNTYCIVCHGAQGMGDGSIVPPYPKPPSLHSEKVTEWRDGDIFHVITMGQNIMPSYAGQIAAEDRWAAIHYVRVLQRAMSPSNDDVKAAEKAQGGSP